MRSLVKERKEKEESKKRTEEREMRGEIESELSLIYD